MSNQSHSSLPTDDPTGEEARNKVQLTLTELVPILGVFLAIAVNSEQKAELLVAIAVGGVGFVVMFFLERFIDHTIDGLEKVAVDVPRRIR